MRLLPKIFILLVGFLWLSLFSLHAGELEKLSRELDYLEEHYWSAAALPETSVMRSHFAKRLKNFNFAVSNFYRKLYEKRIPKIPNLVIRSQELINVFFSIRSVNLSNKKIVMQGTGMSSYRQTFMRNQRYYRTNKKGAKRPQYPTLRNINQTSYNIWVERICNNNAQRLKRVASRRNRKSKSNHGLRQKSETYVLAIAGLRAGFVALAQNPHYKEK